MSCVACAIQFVSVGATQISLHSRRASGAERVTSVIAITPEFAARYQLGAVLGTGAMGQVFESTQIATGRRCAVKFLTRLGEPEILSRFIQEGRVLKSLDHDNVVRVLDSDQLQSHPYIVTELLGGGTLRQKLRAAGRLGVTEAVTIARECLAALEACHAKGIIHRDVKPENVMFGDDGHARLVDFGIAKAYGEATHTTRAGVMIGTPRYMPPELLRGLPATLSCDVYATGALLFEMITGRPPFDTPALKELVPMILNAPAPRLGDDVPEWVANAVAAALSKRIEERWASAREFAEALASSDSEASKETPVQLTFAPEPEIPPPAGAAGSPRARLWLVLAVLALALALAGRAFGAEPPVIVIDPGHPSEVADGAAVHFGTSEVHEAWEVALRLRSELEAAGYRVVLTKAKERELVKNRRRAEIANEAKAALMVRLHCDAAAGSGWALYHPDRQGRTQGVTGPTEAVIAESGRAARALHDGMAPVLAGQLKNNGVKGDSATFIGGKQGALTGSIFSEVPVVTVEMVVLTTASDAAWIRRESGRATMAHALAQGVARYRPLSPGARPSPASPAPPSPDAAGPSAR